MPPRASGPAAGLAAAVAFPASAQALCLGTAAAGLEMSAALAWAILAVAAGAAIWAGVSFREGGGGAPASAGRDPLGAAAGAAALALAAAAWLLLWRLAWLRSPYDWDGLYYHLPALSGWAAAGRVVWLEHLPDIPFANGYPMGVEALGLVVHRALGTSRLADAGDLWHWPLAVCGLAVLAERLGARGGWRWLAGGLIIGAPVFVAQSVTCYSDPSLGAAVIAAAAATLVLAGDPAGPRPAAALLWGGALGLALGVKAGGVLPAALLGAAGALAALRRGRARPARAAWALLLAIAAALAVGGYWYLRNAARTGNPIFPIELRLGGLLLASGYDPVAMTDANLPGWLAGRPAALRPLVSWLQLDAPITGYAPTGGLGFIWLAGGLPALAAAWGMVWRRRRAGAPRAQAAPAAPDRAVLLALTLGAAALLAAQPGAWWGRMTVWLHALGLPCLAVALQAAAGHRRGRRLAAGAATLLLLAVAAGEAGLALDHARRENLVRRPGEPPVYLSSADAIFPGLADDPGFAGLLAADRLARGPWSRAGTLLGGVLAQPLGARRIISLPAAPSPEDLDRLRRDGVDWIVWDAAACPVPLSLSAAASAEAAFAPAPDIDFRALRLRPADVE